MPKTTCNHDDFSLKNIYLYLLLFIIAYIYLILYLGDIPYTYKDYPYTKGVSHTAKIILHRKIYFNNFFLISYMLMPAATDALRDSASPVIFIVNAISELLIICSATPWPSFPIIKQILFLLSILSKVYSESTTVDTI